MYIMMIGQKIVTSFGGWYMSSSEFQDQRCRGSCYKVVVFVATGLISTAQSIKIFFVPVTTTKFWPRCPQKVGNRDNAESAAKELKTVFGVNQEE